MNAPFNLQPQAVPTTERPAFKDFMALAKSMGKPTAAKVAQWVALWRTVK